MTHEKWLLRFALLLFCFAAFRFSPAAMAQEKKAPAVPKIDFDPYDQSKVPLEVEPPAGASWYLLRLT